ARPTASGSHTTRSRPSGSRRRGSSTCWAGTTTDHRARHPPRVGKGKWTRNRMTRGALVR
ncbi:hypothetical protein BGZ59_009201, partial [Podila verticillata]